MEIGIGVWEGWLGVWPSFCRRGFWLLEVSRSLCVEMEVAVVMRTTAFRRDNSNLVEEMLLDCCHEC
jgi:hypothetical protein